MKVLLTFVVALLAIPVWAQDPSASVEPNLQPMEVEPTFVDGSPEVQAKSPGTVEKTKEGILRGYDALKQKIEQKKEQKKAERENQPKRWERFVRGKPETQSRIPIIFGGWLGRLLLFLALICLAPIVVKGAKTIGEWISPGNTHDDKVLEWIGAIGMGAFAVLVGWGLVCSIPLIGYLIRPIAGLVQLVLVIAVYLLFRALCGPTLKENNGGGKKEDKKEK